MKHDPGCPPFSPSFTCIIVFALGMASLKAGAAEPAGLDSLPGDLREIWVKPSPQERPLQIVHGIHPRGATWGGIEQILREKDPERAIASGMEAYRDLGLGGLVCNVAFQDYLVSEPNWKTLISGVEACEKLGMLVWIYDEQGYPSGAAGGLVLKRDPKFEAEELAFDASRADPFLVRPAYEHTHASNNFYAARRYINLIDAAAVKCFIELTHEAYASRLGRHFGKTIQAFFTDEPSLMPVNLGQLGESVRQRVPVRDLLDPRAAPLPAVPWGADLAERYKDRYGEDLLAVRRSLFHGDSGQDKAVRARFWALIADLVAERYFGQIQDWCAGRGVASSGHCLWEEAVIHHVPLMGNGLKALSRMDIPGLDALSSNPEAAIHGGWLTAALPVSAAYLNGRRRVMTEVSDFVERSGGPGPVTLAEMQATAAWQAAWGVTEFTLYYSIPDRPAQEYRAYCDFVGRLNAVFKTARPQPCALLYYPIRDLWSEYLPVAGPISLESQSPRARRIVNSFQRLGQMLVRAQIPFLIVDHEHLATARVREDGLLSIKGLPFRALILAEECELPPPAASVVQEWRARGGKVLVDASGSELGGQALSAAIEPPFRLEPPSERIVLGSFLRRDRRALLLVNVGRDAYRGELAAREGGVWEMLDPATGAVEPAAKTEKGGVALDLAARKTLVLLGPAASSSEP